MPRNTNDPVSLPAAPFIHPDLNSRLNIANALPLPQRDAGVLAAILDAQNYAISAGGGGSTIPSNALTYGGEVLTYAGEILTYGV